MNRQIREMCWRLLLSMRAQLRGEVSLLVDTARDVDVSEPPLLPHAACRVCRTLRRTATVRTLRDFIQRLIDHKEATLYRVENALSQIVEGSYGLCQQCEDPIPDDRLLTIPYTTVCGTCHSQQTAR